VIDLPVRNTRAHPYRGLSMQEVDFRLTERSILDHLAGREVYRRTDFLTLRSHGETALVAVRKADLASLFSPVVEARVLSGPDETAYVESPDTDVGNAWRPPPIPRPARASSSAGSSTSTSSGNRRRSRSGSPRSSRRTRPSCSSRPSR